MAALKPEEKSLKKLTTSFLRKGKTEYRLTQALNAGAPGT